MPGKTLKRLALSKRKYYIVPEYYLSALSYAVVVVYPIEGVMKRLDGSMKLEHAKRVRRMYQRAWKRRK